LSISYEDRPHLLVSAHMTPIPYANSREFVSLGIGPYELDWGEARARKAWNSSRWATVCRPREDHHRA